MDNEKIKVIFQPNGVCHLVLKEMLLALAALGSSWNQQKQPANMDCLLWSMLRVYHFKFII